MQMVYIKRLDIKTFRGISSLQLDELCPINILTGDNNSGKTSVLEVIRSYESPEDLRAWGNLLRRGLSDITGPDSLTLYEGFYDLFNINQNEKKVEYVIETDQNHVQHKEHVLLTAVEGEEELTWKEYGELAGIYHFQDGEAVYDNTVILPKIDIQVTINDKLVSETYLVEGQRRNIYRNGKVPKREEEHKIIYISPSRHTQGNVYLSEILKYPELYEEMLEILRDYDEDIISINYDNDGRYSSKGIYKILSKSYKEALPLNMYGDGMKKAILLMSAVLKAQNGILLLDEFETAIHTSAMDRTFRWILETCLKLNVQVFLTSHSKEAIDKVLKCSEKVKKNIALYTLYKDNEKISARRLTGEKAIEAQDEMGLELR